MARTLKTRLDLDNAQAIRKGKQYIKTMKDGGRAGKTAGTETQEGMAKATSATDKLIGSAKSMIGAFVGWRTVTAILGSLRRELDQVDEATERILGSMRGVLALSDMAGRRPAEQQNILQMAAVAGRRPEEVTSAYYMLLGGTRGMGMERRRGLMQQALLWGKTDPQAPLTALVNMLTTMGAQREDLTPQQIGNLASVTIEAAKAEAGQMATSLPRLLGAAKATGQEAALPMALFAFISRGLGDPSEAATSARAIMFGLGKPPAQTLQEMRRLGFDPKASMLEKLRWLGRVGPRMPEQLAMQIGGRRGIAALGPLATQPELFEQQLAEVRGGLAAPGSLFQQRLTGLYGEMPAQRMMDQTKQLRIMTDIERVRPEKLAGQQRIEAAQMLGQLYIGEGVLSPINRDVQMWFQKGRRYLGFQPVPEDILTAPEKVFFDLMEQGYSPAELMQQPGLRKWLIAEQARSSIGGQAPASAIMTPEQEALWGGGMPGIRAALEGRGIRPMQQMPSGQGVTVNINQQYNTTPADNAHTDKTRASAP